MDQVGQESYGKERADSIDLVTIPGIHRRFLDTFFSPAKMNAYLAAEPRWVMALVLSAALMSLQVALIPSEVWESFMREQLLAQGGTPLPMPDRVTDWMSILTVVGVALSTSMVITDWSGSPHGHLRFRSWRRRGLPTIPCGYCSLVFHSGPCGALYHASQDRDSRPSVNA